MIRTKEKHKKNQKKKALIIFVAIDYSLLEINCFN